MKTAFKKLTSIAVAVLMAALLVPAAAFADEPTGSITIEPPASVSIDNKTFNAYKILDLKKSGSSYAYSVPVGMESFYRNYFDLDADVSSNELDAVVKDKIEDLGDNTKGLYDFAAAALAAAKDSTSGVQPQPSTIADHKAKISNLPYGFYVVEDASGKEPVSALMLDSVDENVTITLKADQPKVDKYIDGEKDTDSNTENDVKYNSSAVGDKVPYKVVTKVPNMTGYNKYYFVLNDTLSKGLTFNESDLVIKVGTKTLTKDTDFTVTSAPGTDENGKSVTNVKIVFKNFIQYNIEEYKDAAIAVTYSATINNDAEIGTEGNMNSVKLTYSNNPATDESGNPGDEPGKNSPTGETTKSHTKTFVTDIKLTKVDAKGNRLTGAKFQIEGTRINTVLVTSDAYTEDPAGEYWKLNDGTYTTESPNADGMDTTNYENVDKRYKKTSTPNPVKVTDSVKANSFVGADGVLSFGGLAAGTYTITELEAPEGYNLLTSPITVTIGCTLPTDEMGTSDCTWSYNWGEGNGSNTNALEVVNQEGSILPSTGGIGTTIFYVGGAILIVGALAALVIKRRSAKHAA